MKPSRIFWASLFIVIGLLALLSNFSLIELEWHTVWRFWPVLLILIGVAALVKSEENKWIIIGVVGVLSGLVIFAAAKHGCNRVSNVFDSRHDVSYQEISEPYDPTISRAVFRIEAGAGKFTIEDTTSELISVVSESSLGDYRLQRERRDGAEDISLTLEDGHSIWRSGSIRNRVWARLNPAPEWDMDFDIGAASADFDLSPFRTREIGIDAGAASVDLKIGDLADSTNIRIGAGAASITIRIPVSSDCEINLDTGLSSWKFEDFEKVSSNLYRTKNYGSGKKKVIMEIDAGVSSFRVHRY